MPTTPECDCDIVSNEGLLALLRDSKNIIVLDCRSSNEFGESHIRDAVNFSIPSIMLRRLAAGKIDLASTIKCRELKQRICSTYKENTFILYNDLSGVHQNQSDSVLGVLLRRLMQDGCRVACLEGGFPLFRASYPEWCDSCSDQHATGPDPLPLMGLRSLCISAPPPHRPNRSCDSLYSAANSSTESSDTDDRCDSSLGLEEDRDFPIEIVPYLFLGNAQNSGDSQALAKHHIQYILNVTPDLPNVFENVGNFKYMKIPIADHWSANAEGFFTEAIKFIQEARSSQKGVLVHCLAGVSRSVTITLAYLMSNLSLTLQDAFELVRARKSNIQPNLNFLQQLQSFEERLGNDGKSSQDSLALIIDQMQKDREEQKENKKELVRTKPRGKCPNCTLGPQDCKCSQYSEFLSPLTHIGVSPDSGIEFDRWGTGTPGE